MAKKLYEEADIQAIANAIRGKNGLTDTYKTSEMAAAITNLPTSGGSEPVISALNITENGTYNAPGGVDGYNPVTVSVPTNVMAKEITANGVYNPVDDGVDGYSPVTVNVPTSGDNSMEDGLIDGTGTEYVNDRVTAIANSKFSSNTALEKVKFANVKTIGEGAFRNCTALIEADFGSATSISEIAFNGCSNFRKLILRSNQVVALNGTAVFGNSSFTNYGYIYVPGELLSEYRNATNWSKYSSRITAIKSGM